MAETPEEVAERLWQAGLNATQTRLAMAALRAQYVAGLEAAARVPEEWCNEPFCACEPAQISRRIRELAEQAKREGT